MSLEYEFLPRTNSSMFRAMYQYRNIENKAATPSPS